jgi:hypothetical protein
VFFANIQPAALAYYKALRLSTGAVDILSLGDWQAAIGVSPEMLTPFESLSGDLFYQPDPAGEMVEVQPSALRLARYHDGPIAPTASRFEVLPAPTAPYLATYPAGFFTNREGRGTSYRVRLDQASAAGIDVGETA